MCVCVEGGRQADEANREKQKTGEGGGSAGEFRYKNRRKLKDKEVAWDQQEAGRARDER